MPALLLLIWKRPFLAFHRGAGVGSTSGGGYREAGYPGCL